MKKSQDLFDAISDSMSQLAKGETYECVCCDSADELPMPSTDRLKDIVRLCREISFPGFFAAKPVHQSSLGFYQGVCIEQMAHKMRREVYAGLCLKHQKDKNFCPDNAKNQADAITADFVRWLPSLRQLLIGDVNAIFAGDPAAHDRAEVILAYPAVRAISGYRIAHKLFTLGVPLIPRVITEIAHSETGIDINPQAQIGERFAIDHGTGIVIGATCIIGNNVKIYQGVTLGALSHPDADKDAVRDTPRHPIIGNNVVIYAQATILGRIHIGDNAVIGGNVWLTNDIPDGAHVTQHNAQNSHAITTTNHTPQ
ncbi:MAG: serine acetyltransferase [Bacteroidales bacterium]|nr:serine acetyltransferase [Bacteroidales bacterium]